MLQLPPIQATAPKPQSVDTSAATQEDSAFEDVLALVGSDLPPEEWRAEVRRQVDEGVPLDEVLDNLVQQLEDAADQPLPPAMMPVLSAVVQEAAAPLPDLLSRLPGMQKAGGADLVDARPIARETFLNAATEDEDGASLEQVLGKEKALLTTRLTPTEALTPVTQAPMPRMLDLPASLAAALPATTSAEDGDLLSLPPRVGEAGWGQAMAQRVMWLVGREQQSAEIRLNPAHLGPLEVKVTVQHDQASVSLLAHNGAVRDALEQALPRLRDLFSQQDIQLVQVDVGQRQDPRGGQADTGPGGQQTASVHFGTDVSERDGNQETPTMVKRQTRGLLDAYA